MKVSLYVLALIIVTVLLSLVDLPALHKKKAYKEFLVVVFLFSMGFILNVLLIIDIKFPNPNKFIIFVIQVFMSK